MCSQNPENTFKMIAVHFDSTTGQIINKKVVDIDTRCPEPYNACMDKLFTNMIEEEKITLMCAIQTNCEETLHGIVAKINNDIYLFFEL